MSSTTATQGKRAMANKALLFANLGRADTVARLQNGLACLQVRRPRG